MKRELRLREIAVLENVSLRSAQRWVRSGELCSVIRGRERMVLREEYEAFKGKRDALCGLDKVEPDPVPVPTEAVVAPEPCTEQKPAPKETCEEYIRRTAPVVFRPANPNGVLTNCPHPNSSNFCSPDVVRQVTEQNARNLIEQFKGNPDDYEKKLNT